MMMARMNAKTVGRGHDGRAAEATALNAVKAVFMSVTATAKVWPTSRVLAPRKGTTFRSALDDVEVNALMAAAGETADSDLAQAVIRFLVETGSRRQGLLTLTRSRLRAADGLVVLVEKFEQERLVPLSAEMFSFLEGLRAERFVPRVSGDSIFLRTDGKPITRQWLLRTFQAIRSRLNRAVVPHADSISPHLLRYTLSHRLYRLTDNMYLVEDFIGHRATRTIQTYVRMTEGERIYLHDTLFPHWPADTGRFDVQSPAPVSLGTLPVLLRTEQLQKNLMDQLAELRSQVRTLVEQGSVATRVA